MKKFFLFFMILLGADMIYAATTFQKINGIYYNIDTTAKTAEVTKSNNSNEKYSGQIDIPETVTYKSDDYIVTSISAWAFQNNDKLISIKIPNSIITMGNNAFVGCTNLLKVEIGNGITSISYACFSGCNKLEFLTLPDNLIALEGSAFYGCSGLTNISIPNSVISIGDSAFSGCSGLTSITIPNSVTEIGKSSFAGCLGINEFILSNSISSIPAYGIPSNLQSLEIPASVVNCEATGLPSNAKTLYLYPTNPPLVTGSIEPRILFGCTLYVPETSIEQYKTADGWKDFVNILPIPDHQTKNLTNKIQYLDNEGYEINNHAVALSLPIPEPKEGYQFLKWTVLQSDLDEGIRIQAQYIGEGTENNLFYLDKDGEEMHSHSVTLSLPEPEEIPGYTFQKWVVVGGDLDEGIHVQAQYVDDGVITDVSSPEENDVPSMRKTLRNGQVYILRGDDIYDVSGKKVVVK